MQNSPVENYFQARSYAKLKDKLDALNYLKEAIKQTAEAKQKAKEDPDFVWLWPDPDFQNLTK